VLPDIQDGWSSKGLISETGDKQKDFFCYAELLQNQEN